MERMSSEIASEASKVYFSICAGETAVYLQDQSSQLSKALDAMASVPAMMTTTMMECQR